MHNSRPLKPQSSSSEGVMFKVVFMLEEGGGPGTRYYRNLVAATKFANSIYCANVYDDRGNRLSKHHV